MTKRVMTLNERVAARFVANDPAWRTPIPSRVGRIAQLSSYLIHALDYIDNLNEEIRVKGILLAAIDERDAEIDQLKELLARCEQRFWKDKSYVLASEISRVLGHK